MGGSYDLSRIVGDNPEIHKIISRIKKIAEAGSPVLFIGELGTGKRLIARAIHFSSSRADLPFLPVNCQAIPPDRIESELFGQVKGLPEKPSNPSRALFEEANGGTIYLDKVDELSDSMQFKSIEGPGRSGNPAGRSFPGSQGRSPDYRRLPQGPGASGPGRSIPGRPLPPAQSDYGKTSSLAGTQRGP